MWKFGRVSKIAAVWAAVVVAVPLATPASAQQAPPLDMQTPVDDQDYQVPFWRVWCSASDEERWPC